MISSRKFLPATLVNSSFQTLQLNFVFFSVFLSVMKFETL
jgi:hypothetical protein